MKSTPTVMRRLALRLSLAALLLALLTWNGCLFRQNLQYRKSNRSLLIQNDSLFSVNLHMKQQLDTLLKTPRKMRLASR